MPRRSGRVTFTYKRNGEYHEFYYPTFPWIIRHIIQNKIDELHNLIAHQNKSMENKIPLSTFQIKPKTRVVCILFLIIACFTSQSGAKIFAQSGYSSGQDGVLLLTDKCPSDHSGELKIAVARTSSGTTQGCYVVNKRGNAIIKWEDGSIQELDWRVFGENPLSANEPIPATWEFFSDTTTRGTPVCGLFFANSDKNNVRNVSVKQLANQDFMTVTLYNDKWKFSSASPMHVVLDFGDNQSLKLSAYADGNILDVALPKESTATFLLLKQFRTN